MKKTLFGYSVKEVDATMEAFIKQIDSLSRQITSVNEQLQQSKREAAENAASPDSAVVNAISTETALAAQSQIDSLTQRVLDLENEVTTWKSSFDAIETQLDTVMSKQDELMNMKALPGGDLSLDKIWTLYRSSYFGNSELKAVQTGGKHCAPNSKNGPDEDLLAQLLQQLGQNNAVNGQFTSVVSNPEMPALNADSSEDDFHDVDYSAPSGADNVSFDFSDLNSVAEEEKAPEKNTEPDTIDFSFTDSKPEMNPEPAVESTFEQPDSSFNFISSNDTTAQVIALNSKIQSVTAEMESVSGLIKSCLAEDPKSVMDSDAHKAYYESLIKRYDALQQKQTDLFKETQMLSSRGR